MSSWVVIQLGAREHFAVARALQSCGALRRLRTDAWVAPGNLLGAIKQSLRERFHPDLQHADVQSANLSLLFFEAHARLCGLKGWDLILARNRWFQRHVVRKLADGRWKMEDGRSERGDTNSPPRISNASLQSSTPVLFSYSYTALEPFRWAKANGWCTVLGQIDPGLVEERLVVQLQSEAGQDASQWMPAPADYWKCWREECALADRIAVNSNWSRDALTTEGVPVEKIAVVPLAFSPPAEAAGFQREYPSAFTAERPLRVLFLGQVNLRKGIMPLMAAMRQLREMPVEFWMVGPMQMKVPADLQKNARLRWIGTVSRGDTADYYRRADVFLFPTFSDGFGLTQLEAQAWRLPVIASRFCGEVVKDGVNGVRLPEVTGTAIASVLRDLLAVPTRLRQYAANSRVGDAFSLSAIGRQLLALTN